MVMSDGVHDNLHPQSLAISPADLKVGNYTTWEEANNANVNVEDIAAKFRLLFLKHVLDSRVYSPTSILDCAMKLSEDATFTSREFMETQPGKRLPKDYALYPGKMDHTTCVIFKVGAADFQNPISQKFVFFCANFLLFYIFLLIFVLDSNNLLLKKIPLVYQLVLLCLKLLSNLQFIAELLQKENLSV